MEDVARRAGVSRSLVSLVFQDAPNVSEARRSAVHDAAEELGYRPNRLARNLARGRTMTLGVVVDDLHPFFGRSVEGIEQQAEAAGYHTLIANGARSAGRTAQALATFGSLQVDGAIAVGARGEVSGLIRATPDIPLVLISFEGPSSEVDTVNNDESTGAGLVVDHLISLGHQRILHVDGGQGASASGRSAGYSTAMKRVGLGANIDIIVADYTYESGQKAAVTVTNAATRPTAVFAANDLNALGMISEFNRLGVGVPSEISVVGYDDTSYVGNGPQGLTTVHQPVQEMGSRAAELLLERIDGGRTESAHEVLPPTLVVRSTTAPAAT